MGINDQYLLGPKYLVAPITTQGATRRKMYFPAGAKWQSLWNSDDVVVGGVWENVTAALDTIPVYTRV